MYEQDYIMRMNRDVIRTLTKLLFNKDSVDPISPSSFELNSEDKKELESLTGQTDMGNLNDAEERILAHLQNGDERALEKALLFYSYLNEQTEEFLASSGYDHDQIKDQLRTIASKYGLGSIV